MATAQTKLVTAEEFWEFVRRSENDGKNFELENGEITEMPSPSEIHGTICAWIAHLLWDYVIERGRGRVCSNDTGLIVKRNPDTVRGPDIMVFDQSLTVDKLNRTFADEIPRLVVEVLSPSDRIGKLNKRVQQYRWRGVPLVWVVDIEDRIVTVHRPDKEQQPFDETENLDGGDGLPDFSCPVADLFNLPGQS